MVGIFGKRKVIVAWLDLSSRGREEAVGRKLHIREEPAGGGFSRSINCIITKWKKGAS